MNEKIKKLLESRERLIKEQDAIVTKAKTDKRDLSEEERASFDAKDVELDKIDKDIEQEERMVKLEERKRTLETGAPGPEERGRVIVGEDREAGRPFANHGEFLKAVRAHYTPGMEKDNRLYAHQERMQKTEGDKSERSSDDGFLVDDRQSNHLARAIGIDTNKFERRDAGSGSIEGVGSLGGFLVGTDRPGGVEKRNYNNTEVFARCAKRTITTGSNSIELGVIDETSRADGSRFGGVRVYSKRELAQMSESKPKVALQKWEVDKITGLYYASDEVLEDAVMLEQEVDALFVEEFDFKIQDYLVNGLGSGQPLGIMNSAAKISVAKETGQGAATIISENISKMWARMWAASRSNAVWFINQDIEPQLDALHVKVGTGGIPVYMPANGLSAAPYGTLKGRPVIPIEQCQTLGTSGDIILADFSQYLVVTKGAINRAMSIHLKFDYNQTAFRWTIRLDGKPRWSSALTPYKGSNTLSPFVVLASR
jgi:HK97 family phage major capsid protein